MRQLLRSIYAKPKAWVRLLGVSFPKRSVLLLHLSLDASRGGRSLGTWKVEATGLLEYHISDSNGGGLRLSNRHHPAARQYTDSVESLRFEGIPRRMSMPLWENSGPSTSRSSTIGSLPTVTCSRPSSFVVDSVVSEAESAAVRGSLFVTMHACSGEQACAPFGHRWREGPRKGMRGCYTSATRSW